MTREEALSILKSILADLQRGAKDTDNVSCCLEYGFITYGKAKDCIKALEQEPCEDTISRKSIKHKLQEHYDFLVDAYGGFSNLPQNDKSRADEITNCIAMVVNEPSVTLQEPRKGHWLSHREHCENLGVMPSGLGAYEWCSNCDCGIDVREWHRNHYNFCPNCGSDNREVEE